MFWGSLWFGGECWSFLWLMCIKDRKMLFKCIVKRRFFLVDVIFKSKKVKVLYRFYSIEFGLVLILG